MTLKLETKRALQYCLFVRHTLLMGSVNCFNLFLKLLLAALGHLIEQHCKFASKHEQKPRLNMFIIQSDSFVLHHQFNMDYFQNVFLYLHERFGCVNRQK